MAATPTLEQPRTVLLGDDPADHDRHIHVLTAQQCDDLRDELEVASRQDRKPHDVDVLVAGRGGDLLGRQADAGVHDLHACIACRNSDLLGAVRVTVEPGLCDEKPRRASRHHRDPRRTGRACRRRDGPRPRPRPSERGTRRTPRAASAPTRRSCTPALAQAIVGGMRFAPPTAAVASSRSAASTAPAARCWRQASTSATMRASTCGSTRRIASSPSSGDAVCSVNVVHAHDDLLA